MPGIPDRLAGPVVAHSEPTVEQAEPTEVETDNLGVPAGHVSVYNGPISQPVIPGVATVGSQEEPAPEEAIV